MTDDPDKAAALFAEIATEQQVIEQPTPARRGDRDS